MVVAGSVAGGVVSGVVYQDHSGFWAESHLGRANPLGKLFQWSSGDMIEVWAWLEAEEMER